MKKRFYQILKCVSFAACVVSLGSCKDTSEDLFFTLKTEIINQNVTLQEALDSRVEELNALRAQIEKLQGDLAAIKSCDCDQDALNALIQALEARIAALENAPGSAEELASLNALVQELVNNYATINSFITNTAVTKQELEDAKAELVAMISDCKCPEDILETLQKIDETLANVEAKANVAAEKAQEAKDAAAAAQDAAANALQVAGNAKDVADAAKTLAEEAKAVANLNTEAISDIKVQLVTINGKLEDAIKDAADALAKAEANEGLIEDLTARIEAIEGVASAVEDLAKLQEDVVSLKEDLDTKITEEKAQELLDNALAALKEELEGKIDANTTKIADLTSALENVNQELQDKIADLQNSVDSLTERVTLNEKSIKAILTALAKQVTGVIIQGSHNPLFGSLTLPTGFQTNVLVAYYGETVNEVYFPTNRTGNYIDADEALTSKDMQMIGASNEALFEAGDVLMSGAENNAGTLYLTVNPNTVDYTGLKLNIENSQAQKSAIKLSPLKESKKVLGFGYSRANGNAFYEAAASLNEDDLENVQKIDFNLDDMKGIVKEIYTKRQNASLSAIGNDLYDMMKGFKLDRNAVKCEWNDGEEDHAVYSDYSLAATAVKPLGFNFAKDLQVVTVPGYERASKLLNRVSGGVKNKIHFVFNQVNGSSVMKDIDALKINDVTVEALTPELLAQFKVNIDKEITIDGLTYNLKLDKDVEVPIQLDVNVPAQTITTPTISLESDQGAANPNKAVLLVPVYDGSVQVGIAEVPLNQLHVEGSDKDITIGSQTVPINEIVTATINIDEIIELDAQTFNFTYEVDLSGAVEDLWGSVETSIGGVNDMLADLRKIVDDVKAELDLFNSYEDRIDATIDNYTDKIQSYIDRVNNKLVGYINQINFRLQPVMLASTMQGSKLLSRSKDYPTVLEDGDPTFIPTTWTMELAVPVCRKHVAVTNVFNGEANAQDGDAACLQALKDANSASDMNVVFEGNHRRAFAKNFAKGYTYEVAYSAMDFHGNIATKKYYIYIK